MGSPSAYQGLLLAPPQALLGPSWLCGSSWPGAQQTSVPSGFQTGTFPLPRKDDVSTEQTRTADPCHWAGTQPLTVISPFFLASFINFFLFFFPLKAKSNSCRALATRMRREYEISGTVLTSFFKRSTHILNWYIRVQNEKQQLTSSAGGYLSISLTCLFHYFSINPLETFVIYIVL